MRLTIVTANATCTRCGQIDQLRPRQLSCVTTKGLNGFIVDASDGQNWCVTHAERPKGWAPSPNIPDLDKGLCEDCVTEWKELVKENNLPAAIELAPVPPEPVALPEPKIELPTAVKTEPNRIQAPRQMVSSIPARAGAAAVLTDAPLSAKPALVTHMAPIPGRNNAPLSSSLISTKPNVRPNTMPVPSRNEAALSSSLIATRPTPVMNSMPAPTSKLIATKLKPQAEPAAVPVQKQLESAETD